MERDKLMAAEKYLEQTLIWDLNELLHPIYDSLFPQVGFKQTEIAAVHAQHPGNEAAQLILRLYKREGVSGLTLLLEKLIELRQTRSVELIKNSGAAKLFEQKSNPIVALIPPEREKPPAGDNVSQSGSRDKEEAKMISKRTVDDVKSIRRIVMAGDIAADPAWTSLGAALEDALKTEYSKARLLSERGQHLNDRQLVEAFMEILAQRLLPVSTFKEALTTIGLDKIIKKYADDLRDE